MTCAYCGRESDARACVTCYDAGRSVRLDPTIRVISTTITGIAHEKALARQRRYDRKRAAERRAAG